MKKTGRMGVFCPVSALCAVYIQATTITLSFPLLSFTLNTKSRQKWHYITLFFPLFTLTHSAHQGDNKPKQHKVHQILPPSLAQRFTTATTQTFL